MAFESKIRPITWENGKSKMIDQTVIPYEYKYVEITSGDEMFDAIRNMIVRGAPAIGIAGAQGIVLYAQEGCRKFNNIQEFKIKINNYDFTFKTDNGVFSKGELDFGTNLLIKNVLEQKISGET